MKATRMTMKQAVEVPALYWGNFIFLTGEWPGTIVEDEITITELSFIFKIKLDFGVGTDGACKIFFEQGIPKRLIFELGDNNES